MKRICHVKKLIGSAAFLGLTMMLFPQMSFGQGQGFVSREYRPRWFQEYENYGSYDLRKSPTYFDETYVTGRRADGSSMTQTRQVMSRVSYDPFGNFLLPGGTIYNMQWDQSRLGTSSAFDGTYAPNVFNNLMISSDEFSNWQTRFMIGTTIRAYFTPSTLKMTNFNGIRWDASTRKNSITLLAQPSSGVAAITTLGAHWQSILGDKLKVGGTFISRQRGTLAYNNADIDNGNAGMRDTPRYIYLVLSDGSPQDLDNGPRIYKIQTIINGADLTSQVPMRVFKIKDLLNSKRYYSGAFQQQYVFPRSGDFIPYRPEDQAMNSDSWFLGAMNSNTNAYSNLFSKTTDTNFYGILNLQDFSNPTDPSGRYFAADMSQGYQEATGDDVVIYEFMIPQEARDVKFKVLAANDYCIDLVAAMYRFTQVGEAKWEDQPLSPAYASKWSVLYDGRNVAKAKGNVKDYSNQEWITVAYNRWTGWNQYGLDAQFNWRGLKINGEINEYNALFSYPVNEHLSGGAHYKETARAWFVNLEQDLGSWGFGGELFNYPRNFQRYQTSIDDNDDNNNTVGGTEYPGLDTDWDMSVDTVFNDNTKPFLTYYYDNVVYGDDFNHNGTIDQRENDSASDLPYERDSKGNHLFVKVKPYGSLVTFGRYDIQNTYRDGRNLTNYAKLEKFMNYSNFIEYGWQNRVERVLRDDFKSNRWGVSGTYTIPADYWKNTSFFTTHVYKNDWNLINTFLFTYSKGYNPTIAPFTLMDHQQVLNPVKPSRVSWSLGSTHKTDWTYKIADARLIPDIYIGGYRIIKEKRIKELKFQPMLKLTNSFATAYSLREDLFYTRQSYNLYPIIRVDYRVAPNTLFRCGFQGLPGFPELNRVVRENQYDDYSILNEYNNQRLVVAFENRTLYQGFNLLVMMGVRKNKQTWLDSRGRKEPGQTEYFIQVQSEGVK